MKTIKYHRLFGILFLTIFFFFFVAFFFSKKELFSENENRYLESFPNFSISSFLDGTYSAGISTYIEDHFPFRNFFMSLHTSFQKWLGKREINGVFYGSDGYLIEAYKKAENSDKIISSLNDFYKDQNYANTTLMLVPTSIVINREKLPNTVPTYSMEEEISYIYSKIKFETIDLVKPLKEGNLNYPMFYRLDHHWTSYGAYYAYLEYCKYNEITPIDITEFEVKEVSNHFRGVLYSKVLDSSLKPDKIHVFQKEGENYLVNYVGEEKITNSLYEESYLSKKDEYSYFLDNNHALVQITNQNLNNGKELLLIKDSFANSMVPFLLNHYEVVHVIDPRFYKKSIKEYMGEHNNIKDVLFLYNMNSVDSDLGIRTID